MTKFKSNLLAAAMMPALLMLAVPSALAADAGVLEIKNFVGRITIETGPYMAFDILEQSRAEDVSLESTGRSLYIDGNVKRPRSKDCKSMYGRLSWNSDKSDTEKTFGGYKNLETYPRLTIKAPEGTVLKLSNSIVFGTAGDFSAANISDDHCSRFQIGDVGGALTVNLGGSGSFDFGNAGDTELRIGGAADIDMGYVKSARIMAGGASNASVGNVAGELWAKASGSADVEIADVTGRANIGASGASDININRITGLIDAVASGSADMSIEDGRSDIIEAKASGSSDIQFGGTAGAADLSASGSSNISVKRVTGDVNRRTSGSADIDVN